MKKLDYFWPRTVMTITGVVFFTQLIMEISGVIPRKAGYEWVLPALGLAFGVSLLIAVVAIVLNAAGEIERLTIELAKYKGITDKLLHDLDAAASERDALKADAYALWMLLDDIDTADDMAKNSDAIYRSLCQQYQKKRWAIMSGERVDAIAAIQGEQP